MGRMTDAEMDEAWEACRPYCEEKGISREAFEIGMRIIEQATSSEDAERLAHFVRGADGTWEPRR